jgi:UDP-glucose 4-epimerase
MSQVWVIGQGGLLGSAMSRLLHREGQVAFSVGQAWQWANTAALCKQIHIATQRFAQQLIPTQAWTIFWFAGQGNLHSRDQDFQAEGKALDALLVAIGATAALTNSVGRICMASSAGAVYGGCLDHPITEHSDVRPTTAYGHAKLRSEAALNSWATDQNHLTAGGADRHAFIGRLSTLYGPGQAWGKQQGLISHLARQVLRHQPLHIYVPLGTQRDYLHVDDAARLLWEGTLQMQGRVACQIIAAEQATTVAEILGLFTRLTRRAPRIVTSAAAAGSIYRHQMTFRSVRPIESARSAGLTPLHIGIHQVLEAERNALAHRPRPTASTAP